MNIPFCASKCWKMHLRESRISKFPGGACPQTPLGGRPFGPCNSYLTQCNFYFQKLWKHCICSHEGLALYGFMQRNIKIYSTITGSPSSLYESHKEHNMASNYKSLYGIFYKMSMKVYTCQLFLRCKREIFILAHFSIRREKLARKREPAWDRSFQPAGVRFTPKAWELAGIKVIKSENIQ